MNIALWVTVSKCHRKQSKCCTWYDLMLCLYRAYILFATFKLSNNRVTCILRLMTHWVTISFRSVQWCFLLLSNQSIKSVWTFKQLIDTVNNITLFVCSHVWNLARFLFNVESQWTFGSKVVLKWHQNFLWLFCYYIDFELIFRPKIN